MERELWPSLYSLLREVGDDFVQKDVSYQPWVIVAVLLWAASHDRDRKWACQRRHWSTTRHRPGRLPSQATVSRRSKDIAVGMVFAALEQRIRQMQRPRLLAFIDGKPFEVVATAPAGWPKATKSTRFGPIAPCPRCGR
jgi:hypothetical protein